MVSKNNRAKQMEDVAERHPHFGIRKLTIGAASVLLSTTLWMSVSTSSVHAETVDSNDNDAHEATESNTETTDITKDTKVVVEANGNATSNEQQSNQSSEVTPSENTENSNKEVTATDKGLTVDKNAAAVQSTVKSPVENKSKSTTQKAAQSAQNSTVNNAEKITQKSATTNAVKENKSASANQVSSNADLTQNSVANTTTQVNANESTTVNNTNKKANTADLSDLGLKGIETNKVPETTKLPVSDLVQSYTGNANDNETDVNQISGLRAAQLLAASFVQNTTGTGSNGAVDLATYNPNFNFTNNSPRIDGHVAYQGYTDKTNGTHWQFATDEDNPGQTIYLYKNGSLVGFLSANGNTTENVHIDQGNTIGGIYQGGQYVFNMASTKIGGITFTRLDAKGVNGSVVNSGATADITQSSKTLVMDKDRDQANPGTWQSGGGETPTKVKQTIWYVDATTGKVLAQKTSDATLSGSTYDATDAQLPEIKVGNQTYKLVQRSDLQVQKKTRVDASPQNKGGTPTYETVIENAYKSSDLGQDVVLATNNGVQIKASDLLGIPLTGTLSHTRIGDIGITNTGYSIATGKLVPSRFYVTQQKDAKGNVELNTYTDNNGGAGLIRAGNISTTNLGVYVPMYFTNRAGTQLIYVNDAAGDAGVPGDGVAAGDGSMFLNGGRGNNQDLIILYTPDKTVSNKQNANIIFVDDDNGGQQIPSTQQQNAEGDAGSQISFDNAATIVNGVLNQGYIYNGTTGTGVIGGNTSSYSNVSFPTYDNDDATNQGFVVHFKHKISEKTTDAKTVNRTIHYIYGDSRTTAAPDKSQSLTFNGTAYYDEVQHGYVTGPNSTTLLSNQNDPYTWTVQNGNSDSGTFDAVVSPTTTAEGIKDGYKPTLVTPVSEGDSNNNVVAKSVNHNSANSDVTVIYTAQTPTPETPTYHKGDEESVTTTRTINYYDKVTGQPIPSGLAPSVHNVVTFTRTEVKDQNNNVVGYGTISADGKSYQNQGWHTAEGLTTDEFAAKKSPDLSTDNYTAPEFQDGTSANVVAAHAATPTTGDLVYNVYYGHQTQPVTTTKDVTRRFHYIFTDGTDPASHLTPQADQTVTFNGKATKDLVTGQTSTTVWTPATGTLTQVAGQPVNGYDITGHINADANGTAANITVDPTSSDIDVTIVYTPKAKTPDTPQRAQVTIFDKTENNKQLTSFNNNNGTKGSAISFDGEPQTLQTYLNSGYEFDSATDANGNSIGTASNINFGNFDNIDGNVQSFNIYLVHGKDTRTTTATTNAHVHYVVAGNDPDKPTAPVDSPTQTINWTKTDTTDKVTRTTTEGKWIPDKDSFTDVKSPTVTNYTPDQANVHFDTPEVNKDQVVTVVYSKNPEVAQKADLVVYDKTDNNKQLNSFDNSGKTGEQIAFSGAANYVADLIANGYKIDSFVNDQNQTSNPTSYDQISYDNFDNDTNSDQHFKLYLVHATENGTENKTTTSTVHYVVSDGKTNPPADSTQTITWTRPVTKDKVTGENTPTGNWTTPSHYTDVPTPNLTGYTPDKTNVPAPTPDPNQNPTTTVTYNPNTPEAPTYTGTTENRTVTRTINYYDKVTGDKIPVDLIAGNPTTQNVTLSRTHVVSSTGQDMGYGTVSADGKTFTKATNADGWNTGSWAEVDSPDLQSAGYTAPDLDKAAQVTVDANTKDAIVNVYYGHQTVVVTPNTPHNPGENINPNDPRTTPSTYPDGLTKQDLQQSVTRHINYVGVNEDGTTTPVNGSPDGQSTYTQTVTFNRNAVVDKVTGKVLGYSTDGTTNVTTTDKDRAWTPATQNMTSVASKTPSEVGYDKVDLSTVGGVTVYPGQKVNDVTVTYTKNKTPEVTQKATLEIIDNNDPARPTQLASFSNEGKSEDQISFNNSNEILRGYLNQGYKVQKTDGNLNGSAQTGYTYPTYGTTAQDFKIYLIHDTQDQVEKATATAQVHYEIADNGVQAPKDSDLQTINYTRTNTVDKVTGQVTKEGTWTSDKTAFNDVVSPDLSKDGYTPSVQTVHFNAPERGVNQRVTVVYSRSAQAADLQIIDDNDPQNQRTLVVYTAGGQSGKQIGFAGSNEQLQAYLKSGYTFEKNEGQGMSGDATNGFTYPVFDNDTQTNQSFKIYLKHATGDKSETQTASAHVHYIMADGTTAPADSPTQTVTWTRTNTVDQVTGQVTKEGTWTSDNKTFTNVDSPEVTGYTPGTKTAEFKAPERGINQIINVVYTKNTPTPDTQKALVVYQDVNNPAHPVDLGQSDPLTGQAGDAINYSTANVISALENKGYVLVSNGFDPNGTKPIYDNIADNTQTFYVTFKHGIQPVNPSTPGTPGDKINPNDPDPNGPKYPQGTDKTSLTKDVTRTVTYEGAGSQTPSPVTDTLHFEGTGYLDKVTGNWTDAQGHELADQTKGITWTVQNGTQDNGRFDLVPTKHIDGYTSKVVTEGADDGNGNVKSYTGITHASDNINVVVQYNPIVAEKGNLVVQFHDDTDNVNIPGVGTDTGSQDVGTQVAYNPSTDLTNLENKGYVYVSTDGNIPSSIVKGTTTVTIHVKHGTVPVNPDNPGKPGDKINPNDPDPNGPKYPDGTSETDLTKTVTRTIHYQGADQYTPNDVKQPVNFTAKGVLDRVTGQWITPLSWSDEQTFDSVTSPKIPGYHVESVDRDTTDKKNVDSATVDHTATDYKVIVTYARDAAPTPETTTGKVSYIDDTTYKTLRTDTLAGDIGTNIDYTTQDKITEYLNKGYKLVSNNFIDGRETFDKDATKNVFEVHLVHDTVPVNPDNPGKPGDKINPNDPDPNGPKYPDGTSETDLDKTITRTVHYSGADKYTPSDVKQPVHFTARGVLDKVTGQWVTPLTWSDDQTVDSVTTPNIPGYRVVSVDKDANGTNVNSATVSHVDSDYTVNVVYAKIPVKQAENANLHIIDLSDNRKELANFKDSGDDNTAINFNGAQTTVDALIKGGYKVNSIVQATSDPNAPTRYGTDYANAAGQWTFDDKPGVDQSFYVFVEHDYAPINPENAYGRTDLTQTVTETVHYVDEATNKPVATDYNNVLTFKGQGKVDKVTGKMLKIKSVENGQITYDYNVDNEIDISNAKLSDFAWSNPVTLQKVTSPTITGYTIDAAKTTPSDLADGNDIKEITGVAYDHGNIEATVYYKANPAEVHKADLIIYANGNQVGTASVTGAKDTAINFGSASDIVAAYIANGYRFDHAQDVTNNKEMTGKSYSELNFGNFATENNSDQHFAIYLTKTETPVKSQQNAQLTVRDVTPGQEMDLGNYTQPGLEGDAISFSGASGFIQGLLDKGYVWDGASYNGTDLTATNYAGINFGNYDNTSDQNGISQKWIINLVHGATPVNPDHPDDKDGFTKDYLDRTITRDVTYVYEDGSQAAAPEHQEAHYTGSGYLDNVTHRWVTVENGKITGVAQGLTWTPDQDTTFNPIAAKTIDGYHVASVSGNGISGYTVGQDGAVGQQTVNRNTPSSTIRVVYAKTPVTPVPANGSITYIDDVTNNTLESANFGGSVGQKIDYTTADRIAYYTGKGYKLVSNDFTDGQETYKQGANKFTVHLTHVIDTANATKTITRDVTYVYENGSQADTPVHQSVTFTGKTTTDKVTGQTTTKWDNESQNFGATKSIDTTKYQIVGISKTNTSANVNTTNGVVDSESVTPTSQNSAIVITLANKPEAPVATTGKVSYIDDTVHQTLRSDSLSGNVGENITYTTQDKINDYLNKGYKLVSNNFTDGNEVFNKDANANSFEVHLIHDTVPVNPNNPGKPGDKINPNDPDPNGPKYPDGTTSQDLTKQITRTIHYSGAGDYTPSDVKQPVNFTAKGVLDKVTGQWVTPLTWSADQTFTGVTTPNIPGYHVVSVDRDANGTNVASTTINHTGSDYIVNVVYANNPVKQAENANLHVIDISDNNKELANFKDSGDDSTAISFNGAQTTIDALIKGGYKVNGIVQATSDPNAPTRYGTDYSSAASQWTFDDKPGVDQVFYVYVEHDYAPINPENAYGRTDLTQTVTETVHYVDEATNKPVLTDYVNTATFKGQGKVDKVTGKMLKIKSIENGQITYDYNVDNEIDISSAKLSDFAWSSPVTLQKVVSPKLAGYTIDAAKTTPSDLADGNDIKEITGVAYDHGNIEATVYYKTNPAEVHKAELTIYANGNQVGTASVTGVKDTAISFGNASAIVAAYIANGYKFDHAQDLTNNQEMSGKSYEALNFGNFATENNSDQKFAIYLTKAETPVKSQQNAQLTVRDVTPGQEMDLGNYTQPGLEGDAISFNDAGQFVQDLLNKGYVWDGASYNGTDLTATNYAGINFGTYDNTSDQNGISQKWVINLVHGVTPVNPDHPDDKDGFTKDYLDRTITRDVTYVYEDGSQAAAPEHQEAHYTGSGYLDNVTGKWVTVENGKITGVAQGLTWTPDQDQSFSAIGAKTVAGYYVASVNGNGISGYTVGQDGSVTAQTVNRNTASSTIRVVYAKTPVTPVPANGSISYIDDTTGDTLEKANFGGTVGQKINYTTADRIAYYENKGYDLVSNNFNDGNETFKSGDNVFTVHLVHATTPITPDKPGKPGEEVPNPNDPEHPHKIPANFVPQTLTKTVTRDVTYVYADGGQASAPVHQTFTFNGSGVIDLVTGQLVNVENGKITGAGKITWNADSHNFDAINGVNHDGYYISNVSENGTTANVDTDTGAVAGETITPASQNSTIVITLTKKPNVPTPTPEQGSITVTVHDVKTNQDVPGYGKDSGKQNTGTDFTYDKTTTITDLENKGYKVINPDVTIPTKVSNVDQHIVIYVDHQVVPVTPDKPGNGLNKSDLDKTVTETVHYVVNGGNTEAPADKTTSLKFTGTAYYDSVTKKWTDASGNELSDQTKNITWTAENGNKFNAVETPKLDGYTPSVPAGYNDGNNNVKEIDNITPSSKNVEVTVTYTKNNVPTPVKQGTIEIVYHDTTDNVDIPGYGQSQVKEDEGTSFSYNPNAKDLPELERKGYVLDGDLPTIPTKFTDGDQHIVINVKHGTTTVTPDRPGKPGEPIDPKNPNGPKYPEGTGENNLKVTGTQVIHYTGAGDKTPKDNTQSFDFTKEITFDNVTGKIIKDSGWNVTSHTFGSEPTPVVNGYHADKTTAGNTTVTPTDLHKTVTVTYTPDAKTPDVPNPVPTPSPEPKPENTPVEPTAPTPTPNISDNVVPTPEPTRVAPHGEDVVQNGNTTSHTVNNWTAPHGQHVDQKGNIVTSDNRVVGYVDQEGTAHYTELPQTGDDKTNEVAAALLGGAAVSIGLVGLAGVKKRRKEEK